MGRVIGIVNLKGGVGKTTTTVNLGAALAAFGLKILLIDLDPQKSLTSWAGINHQPAVDQVLLGEVKLPEAMIKWEKTSCWVIPAGQNLRAIEDQLQNRERPQYILKEKIADLDDFDYILIDSSPSYGLLTINTICAAGEIIIPLQTEILALESTIPFFETLAEIKQKYHPRLKIAGILPNMFDSRTNLSKSILDQMKASPYLGPLMFRTFIRKNVRLAETPSLGCAVTRYSTTHGAEDFRALAEELMTAADRTKIDILFNADTKNEPDKKAKEIPEEDTLKNSDRPVDSFAYSARKSEEE